MIVKIKRGHAVKRLSGIDECETEPDLVMKRRLSDIPLTTSSLGSSLFTLNNTSSVLTFDHHFIKTNIKSGSDEFNNEDDDKRRRH